MYESSGSEDEPYFKPPGYTRHWRRHGKRDEGQTTEERRRSEERQMYEDRQMYEERQKNEETQRDEDERAWKEKLASEFEYENSEAWSAYGRGCEEVEDNSRETHTEWTERIYHEYKSKQRSQNVPDYRYTDKKPHKHKHNDETESSKSRKLKREREKMQRKYEELQKRDRENRSKRRKLSYEEKYRKLLEKRDKILDSKDPNENSDKFKIIFSDLPWSGNEKPSACVELMLDGVEKGNVFKKKVKDFIRTWHPDKFQQKFGDILCDEEREKIVGRVNEISQELNAVYEKL